MNPVIAVILGALVLREPFTVRMALAAALIFAGVGLVRSPTPAGRALALACVARDSRRETTHVA